jgi:hypothetical protein
MTKAATVGSGALRRQSAGRAVSCIARRARIGSGFLVEATQIAPTGITDNELGMGGCRNGAPDVMSVAWSYVERPLGDAAVASR